MSDSATWWVSPEYVHRGGRDVRRVEDQEWRECRKIVDWRTEQMNLSILQSDGKQMTSAHFVVSKRRGAGRKDVRRIRYRANCEGSRRFVEFQRRSSIPALLPLSPDFHLSYAPSTQTSWREKTERTVLSREAVKNPALFEAQQQSQIILA